jgi:ribose transport system ATP-binding protein
VALASDTANMSTPPPRLVVEGLSKSFFGVPVLQNVSFKVNAGQLLGIVGENGSGKSTAMNLLTGVLPSDSGSMWLDGKPFHPYSRRDSDAAGIAFIQQELNVFPNLSVAENLFLLKPPRRFSALPLIARRRMHARSRALLQQVGLEVPPRALAGTLSTGERQLLEIARALSSDARLIIFDEPTTSLTAPEAERLFELIRSLKAKGVTILYISHDLEHVLSLADEVLVLRDGNVAHQGPVSTLTPDDLVLAMVGRSIDALFPSRSPRTAIGMPVLDARGLGEPGVLKNLDLSLSAGEIVGIAGLMGSGRSELARVLFGLDRHRHGQVRVGNTVLPPGDVQARLEADVALLTEDRRHEGLMMDASVSDNMALAALPGFTRNRFGRVHDGRLLEAVRKLGAQLNLKSGDVRTAPVRSLSGGNQQKVVLGRWLLRRPKLFILDEPTRGVDVGAKQEIYRLLVRLADSGMALLVISSELEELTGLCDRIHVMRRGELVAHVERGRFDSEAILRAAFGQGLAA